MCENINIYKYYMCIFSYPCLHTTRLLMMLATTKIKFGLCLAKSANSAAATIMPGPKIPSVPSSQNNNGLGTSANLPEAGDNAGREYWNRASSFLFSLVPAPKVWAAPRLFNIAGCRSSRPLLKDPLVTSLEHRLTNLLFVCLWWWSPINGQVPWD